MKLEDAVLAGAANLAIERIGQAPVHPQKQHKFPQAKRLMIRLLTALLGVNSPNGPRPLLQVGQLLLVADHSGSDIPNS